MQARWGLSILATLGMLGGALGCGGGAGSGGGRRENRSYQVGRTVSSEPADVPAMRKLLERFSPSAH
ncbi:MAG: hypothetical protein ACKV2T_22390 [Kofleriaceae bacterium]